MSWHYTKRLLQVVSLLAVILVATVLAYARFSGDKLLSVQSGSMVPALHKGDLVTVHRIPVGQHLAVGDVITFVNPRNAKQTITHRVIQVPSASNGYKVTTKGDANASSDPSIGLGSVIGRVGHKVPYAGFAIDFTRQPLGLLVIIYLPALLVVREELRRLAAYYKTQLPYRAPGRLPSALRRPRKRHLKTASMALVICIGVATLIAVPARAALMSKATLTGTTITVNTQATHILLRQVGFECSLDNTTIVNKLPGILFYNPTTKDIATGGWYLQSSSGRITTFPARTVFDARSDYDIEPDLVTGLNYRGDYLALFDNTNKLVDAISWGTDTTYLHPSLPGVSDGTLFRRLNTVFDTDTSTDWTVSVTSCTPDSD